MDYLFITFLIICLWGVNRPSCTGLRNRESLVKEDTNAMRGILAVLIMLDHLSLVTGNGCSAVILKKVGFMVVGAFYALSGYGLMVSFKKRGLKNFWGKRFRGVILPYLIISIIYVVVRFLLGETVTIKSYMLSFINGEPVVRYSWFVLTIILFYAFFYFAAVISKGDCSLMIFLNFFAIVLYIYTAKKLHYETFWYNASWAFSLGMIWAQSYQRISDAVARHPWTYIGLTAIMFLIFYFSSTVFYWCGFYGEMLTACTFALLVLISMFKLRFNNSFLQFLGNISFELYLMHGLFIMIFSSMEKITTKPILFGFVVILCTLVSAWVLHVLFEKHLRIKPIINDN